MKAFRPHLEILPQEQRCLWPTLVPLASSGWVLYGGTAIALRYGHRVSVDFDQAVALVQIGGGAIGHGCSG